MSTAYNTPKNSQIPPSKLYILPLVLLHLVRLLSNLRNHLISSYYHPIFTHSPPSSSKSVIIWAKSLSRRPLHAALVLPVESQKSEFEHMIDKLLLSPFESLTGTTLTGFIHSLLTRLINYLQILNVCSVKLTSKHGSCDRFLNCKVDPRVQDIVNFISWCSSIDGIRYTSIYQTEEWTSEMIDKVSSLLSTSYTSFHSSFRAPTIVIRLSHSPQTIIHSSISTDSTDTLTVTFLSYSSSSKPFYINQIKSAAYSNCSPAPVSKLDQSYLTSHLSDVIPEPSLLILPSPYTKLYGYPPFELSLTEIYSIPGNTKCTYFLFVKALERFNDCVQRYGR
ncbi:hypothetical protein BKA69DRAFT_236448 [Paraphysoderma sedebokerense]|nr:hypothetical protein BKA69DRAFT_236448 [Paraphysoderma sedebokerense]